MVLRRKKNRKTISFVFLILSFYIGLPILILLNILPFYYKFHFLAAGALLIYIFTKKLGISNTEIGITKNNWKKSILTALPITIILALAGITMSLFGFSRTKPDESICFFIFYILISSPTQEFLYRGIIPGIIDKIGFGYFTQLTISSLLYSFVHIIYKDWVTLLITLVIGIIWFIDYKKSNNLLGVSISHAILGIITIIAGIIN